MRIESLRLKNMAPIYYSLDKEDVVLDYRSDELKSKTIFIFVGKMGSCKTFLLGHHQPFATLGTLDARNGEDLVLPGKRGIKEIIYTNGIDIFEIMHIYMPSGETNHSIKSYCKKNGVELNPNGNANSFKTIIEVEFGLEQNYLKLFRIGANVTNLPDMGSAERKSFVSSMLAETEVYEFLFKRLGEKSRALNAQMSMLLNRLRSISNRSDDELKRELECEKELLSEVEDQYANLQAEQYRLEGEINAIARDDTYEHKVQTRDSMDTELHQLRRMLKETETDLDALEKMPSAQELSNELAAVRSRRQLRDETIIKDSAALEKASADLNKVRDKLATIASKEQVEILRTTYERLMKTRDEYLAQIKNFTYSGNAAMIESIIANHRVLNELIARVAQYHPELLREFFHNPGKAIYTAKRRTEELAKEASKVRTEMENLSHASTYVATHSMIRPPQCPTKDCPFYKYHPHTEARRNSGVVLDQRYIEHRNRLTAIQSKIVALQDYPTIGNQITSLKNAWNRLTPQMQELGLLNEDDLQEVLINPTKRNWFNLDKANHIRELCGIREKSYEITQRVASMRDELATYDIADRDAMERDLNRLTAQVNAMTRDLQSLEADNANDKASEGDLSSRLAKVMTLENTRDQAKRMTSTIERLEKDIKALNKDINILSAHNHNLSVIKSQLASKKEEYQVHEASCNSLSRKIADIQFCKSQFEEAKVEYDVLKDILEASSSKNGIPLAFVKLFLADCKDTINDLIRDVFQDHIEVQEFYIPENSNEFYIPYTKNGTLVQDVNKASQGERAIISMALNFALIRQASRLYQTSFLYDVVLMDEPDSALYRADREKFVPILMKQMRAMRSEQVFIVSHNNSFDGFNVAIIMTTEENVDESPLTAVIRI